MNNTLSVTACPPAQNNQGDARSSDETEKRRAPSGKGVSDESTKEDNDFFGSMGFMFEGSEASTLKRFEWSREMDQEKKIYAALSVVDESPGAVQSGHYLWPAAPAMVQFLLNETSSKPLSIIELGAGCALASLAALQLFLNTLKCIVVTDHDPGTLKRARDNRASTLRELRERRGERFAKEASSVPMLFQSLSWGDNDDAMRVLDSLRSTGSTTAAFDWILGSDLVYCVDVVEPLLKTVSLLLEMNDSSKFLLAQSFGFDDETEDAIDRTCDQFGLQRTILLEALDQEEGARIQIFQWRTELL